MGPGSPTRIAGIDGCRAGWAMVQAELVDERPRRLEVSIVADLEGVVADARSGRLVAAAVDMPIGLLDSHPRSADVAARAMLGPRRSSVFATPLRVTLDAADYDEACRRSRAVCGKALSKQAWNLMPKIRQLDRLIEPADQDRVVEAHPECAFAHLRGAPLPMAKSSPEGLRLRLDLLRSAFDPAELDAVIASRLAPADDLLDALVLVLTSARVATGSATRLGGQTDPTGLRAEIVY